MQGLYASLELLPMWSGVEPDAQLFASGRVLDDDGEWAGGQSLGEGSGSSAGPPSAPDAFSFGGALTQVGAALVWSQAGDWALRSKKSVPDGVHCLPAGAQAAAVGPRLSQIQGWV